MTLLLSFLFLPCRQYFSLALGRHSGPHFRLSILRKRFEPGNCVPSSVGKRTKDQTFSKSAADVRLCESTVFASPNWHVRPGLDFLLSKKFLAYPCEFRIRH